jgi:hypothetical protein
MRKFHSIAALCGDGLRPELQALFDRLAIDPQTELLVRKDGMIQSGPDPDSEATKVVPASPSEWPNLGNYMLDKYTLYERPNSEISPYRKSRQSKN